MNADSRALILLAKCAVLGTFADSFTIIIPDEVFLETVGKNLPKKYADSKIIADIVSEKKSRVVAVKDVSLELAVI